SKCSKAPALTAWLALHQAAASGPPAELVRAARSVLAADETLGDAERPYVVAALIGGQILAGERAAAWRSFAEYRGRLGGGSGWQPVFRLLVAHTDAPIMQPRSAEN